MKRNRQFLFIFWGGWKETKTNGNFASTNQILYFRVGNIIVWRVSLNLRIKNIYYCFTNSLFKPIDLLFISSMYLVFEPVTNSMKAKVGNKWSFHKENIHIKSCTYVICMYMYYVMVVKPIKDYVNWNRSAE